MNFDLQPALQKFRVDEHREPTLADRRELAKKIIREAVFEQRGRVAAVSGEISRLAGLGVRPEDAEERGTWALPFAAVREGLAAGLTQARAADPQRRLPLA